MKLLLKHLKDNKKTEAFPFVDNQQKITKSSNLKPNQPRKYRDKHKIIKNPMHNQGKQVGRASDKTRKITHTLASSRPRSLTGVPDLGETNEPSDNSSRPIMRPGHHDPFRRRTQTNPPTDASMLFDLASPELLPISETTTTDKQKPKEKKRKTL